MISRWTAIACAAIAMAFPAAAQKAATVDTRLEAHKVVRAADGGESLAGADAAKPGDVIEYVATYRNTGAKAVRNLEATLPIPANTEFVPGTQQPAAARASVDAKVFAEMPLQRKVPRDGQLVEEAVPPREYRYLRWSVPELGPGEAVAFRARVKVLDEGSTAPPGR